MSDPTYVEGWKTSDPLEEIRKQRTEIEIVNSFNRLAAASGSVADEELIKHTIEEVSKRYRFAPAKDAVSLALDRLIHLKDLSRGTFSTPECGPESRFLAERVPSGSSAVQSRIELFEKDFVDVCGFIPAHTI